MLHYELLLTWQHTPNQSKGTVWAHRATPNQKEQSQSLRLLSVSLRKKSKISND